MDPMCVLPSDSTLVSVANCFISSEEQDKSEADDAGSRVSLMGWRASV